MNWMYVPYPECLKNLIKSSTYTENNIGDRTPPFLTPQNIEKFTPRKLFHITDAVNYNDDVVIIAQLPPLIPAELDCDPSPPENYCYNHSTVTVTDTDEN